MIVLTLIRYRRYQDCAAAPGVLPTLCDEILHSPHKWLPTALFSTWAGERIVKDNQNIFEQIFRSSLKLTVSFWYICTNNMVYIYSNISLFNSQHIYIHIKISDSVANPYKCKILLLLWWPNYFNKLYPLIGGWMRFVWTADIYNVNEF